MGTSKDTLSRRKLLEGLGVGALALGAAGCAPITKIYYVNAKCPQVPGAPEPEPILPEKVSTAPTPKSVPSPTPKSAPSPPVEAPSPTLTARAHEVPQLRAGEFVPGLYSADTFPGQVAVSFDDVPKPGFTEIALRRLKEAEVPATWFVVGRLAERHPDLVRAIVDHGHTLGNHTYDHPNLVTLSAKEIADQLDRTQDAVDKALGYHYPLRLVRPPYGLPYYGPGRPKALERVSRTIAKKKGCVALWTLGTKDTVKGCTPERVLKGLKRRFHLGTGGVMVFHPTYCAKGSLRPVFRTLKHKGLTVRTVEDLLEEKYGWPLEELSEWGPKLLERGLYTAAS